MSDAALPPGWPAISLPEAHRLLTAPGSPFEMDVVEIDGRPTRNWKLAPPTLRAVAESVRPHGDKTFLVYEDERVSFDGFHRAMAAFARELTARGVGKGDRVAIVMRNLPEWPVAFYATLSLGAVATPLNAWWTGEELAYGLVDSGAKVAVLDAERHQRLAEHLPRCPDLKRVYVSREIEEIAHPIVCKLEQVIGASGEWALLPDDDLPPAEIAPDDSATLFYTSGTTGKPKGVLSSHRAVNAAIMAGGSATARAALRRGETLSAPDPAAPPKSALLTVPFFHVTGCMSFLNPLTAAGGKLVLMHRWDAARAFELIERERVTVTGGVPTIAWQLLEHPARANYDLSSLEAMAYGGAPAAPELVRQLKTVFPRSASTNGWGMTETTGVVASNGAEDYLARPDSCGPPMAVSDLEVRDPVDGVTRLPVGTVGELWASGPQMAKGYWNSPEATAATFVDGWVRTGDLARLDEEGFCFIIDRAKDMLIRGGENIYCIEVESVLYDHPAVMDAALVGRPHRTLGEEPVAVVTLKPGATATEKELRAHVAEHLAAFKTPVAIKFSADLLPRNANGKILKAELKKLFTDQPVET